MDDSRRIFVKGVLALGALAARPGGCMRASEKPARWISGGPEVDPGQQARRQDSAHHLPRLSRRLRPAVQGSGRGPGKD